MARNSTQRSSAVLYTRPSSAPTRKPRFTDDEAQANPTSMPQSSAMSPALPRPQPDMHASEATGREAAGIREIHTL
ncbi:hypothetical protein NUW54_g11455 [Trametes sanguinea]|uniref:Uncharacterized protein n=1 Tax=Trametes sanguinea TaxID=158606 RepID=A0ACC1ND16_9APHY|nr:hypothetical protein NUW54_g11455 [Trametes sanguinea]